MDKKLVIFSISFLLVFGLFGFVLGEEYSEVNKMFCGKGGIIAPGVKCLGDSTKISSIECLNISEYTILKKWDEMGSSGYSNSYFKDENGQVVTKGEFCRLTNTNYCFYDCVDETKTTIETGRHLSSENELTISEREFIVEESICGNNICEGSLERGYFCTEREDKKIGKSTIKSKSCFPTCYQDCGYIIKNSEKEVQQDLIKIPYADKEGTVVNSLYFDGLTCLDSGFCLEKIGNKGAEMSYKGDKFFLDYYKSYNYEVDVIEGEDRYLFLTYNSFFVIKKSGNPFILFFKNFYI